MAGADQSIVIKRIKKAAHAHHGGVWKLAYADFVTAMMAFFLLLWLLNSVTEEQLEGISNYFAPASISPSQSGSGEMFGGKVLGEPGAMPDKMARPSVTVDLPQPKAGTGGEQFSGDKKAAETATDEQAEELLRRKEEKEFREAEEEIRKAIDSMPSLKALAKSLLIDDTPEGLRIQIVDQEGLAMFPRGSAQMYVHTRRVLELVSKVITKMPQRVSIAGHTDATKYASGDNSGYTNWELSADRANASRRALIELGVPNERVSVVVGKADTDPLVKNDPANASNRRISIVLLRTAAAQAKAAQEILPAPAPAPAPVGNEPKPTPRAPR